MGTIARGIMFDGLRRTLDGDCIGDLRFDALLADELSQSARDSLLEHAARCARCKARLGELRHARARFLQSELATARFLETSPERRRAPRLPRLYAGAACLLAAACALLFLRPRAVHEERSKGGEYVSFYLKRGTEVRLGSVGDEFRAGDLLRFAYTSDRSRELAIVSIDAAKRTSVYFPAAETSELVQSGRDVPLPSAVELDATAGVERVYAVFCDEPFALAPLLAALKSGKGPPRPQPDCVVDELALTKEPPAR